MDPRLLGYYNQELQHLREMGAEFAQQFPKIAARLGMEGMEVADPYVERLLEGAGFLAARVQLKLDAEFPRFTQRLLEIVYPGYLAPTPSMVVVQLQPQLT
ncbi:MAG: type VI secretion system baseplate subunit TssF, partial [Burkholderiales bacterium]